MADETAKIPSPFDVRTIKYLVALMSRHDLSEIDLREGDLRIRLRRGPKGIAVQTLGAEALRLPMAAIPSTLGPSPTAAPPTAPSKPLLEVKSPTPGTFYSQANPGSPAFVAVGARVSPTTVVGIIEAMKIFNEIPADCTGVIAEVLVENQQPVEYGQVLFRVDPTA